MGRMGSPHAAMRAASAVGRQQRCIGDMALKELPFEGFLYTAYDAKRNRQNYPWYHKIKEYTTDPKATDREKFKAVQRRLSNRGFEPVFPTSYTRSSERLSKTSSSMAALGISDELDSEDVAPGRLPFLRNAVGSIYDVSAVLGTPEFIVSVPSDLKHHSATAGSLYVRPENRPRTASLGPSASASAFMAPFLDSFVALDVAEWDIDALMSSIERPQPLAILRSLTELLDQRQMRPRRLADREIAGILKHSVAEKESQQLLDLALERHNPGMATFEVLCKKTDDVKYLDAQLQLLVSRGAAPTTAALNALLKKFVGPAQAEAAHTLYLDILEGRKYEECTPDVVTFNAALRAQAADPEKVLDIFGSMLEEDVAPNTYTLNVVIQAAGALGGFNDAVAMFDMLCGRSGTQRVGSGEEDGTGEVLPPAVVAEAATPRAKPSGATFEHLFHLMAQQLRQGAGGADDDDAALTRLAYIFDHIAAACAHDPSLRPTVDKYPAMGPALRLLSHGGLDLPLPEVSGRLGPRDVDGMLRACDDYVHVRADAAPLPPAFVDVMTHILDATWVAGMDADVLNTPRIFLSCMRAHAALGNTSRVRAVYDAVNNTPFVQQAHHDLVARAQLHAA